MAGSSVFGLAEKTSLEAPFFHLPQGHHLRRTHLELRDRDRTDGGPFLVIAAAEPEDEGVNVFFTDIEFVGSYSAMRLLFQHCLHWRFELR